MKSYRVPGILVAFLMALAGAPGAVSLALPGEPVASTPVPPQPRLIPPAVFEFGLAEPSYTGCGGVTAPVVNAAYEQEVVELVNVERANNGNLPPLKRVTQLDDAGRYHATDMGQDNYFDHSSYDRVGGNLVLACGTWARIQTFYPSPTAENIAAGYSTPQSVMTGWMNSSGHRANILSTGSWEIGVGYYEGGGDYYRYWVQDFGKRSGVYPLVINREAATASSANVSLYLYGTWSEMRLRNDDGAWTNWQPFQNTTDWTLAPVGGERTVWAEMRTGSQTASSSDSIYLDVTNPPTGVSISGPASGAMQQSYTFTATVSPDTAATPITYTWQATGLANVIHVGGLSDVAAFTWSTSGAKTITVTARNAAGAVSGAHVMTIHVPPESVMVLGPAAGWIQRSYTFTATVSPGTAVQPITYTWQASERPAAIHTGGTLDTVTFTWDMPGSKAITVTAVNRAGEAAGHYAVVINVPLDGVAIGGPAGGYINTAYAFHATASPASAMPPVTYTWQATGHAPLTHVSDLSDTATLSWSAPGAQTITVLADNGSGAPVTGTHVITIEEGPSIVVGPAVSTTSVLSYTDGQGNPTIVAIPPQPVTLTIRYIPLLTTQPAPGGWGFAGHAFRLEVYVGGSLQPNFVFAVPLTITVHYSEADVYGMDESSVALFYWNGAWVGANTTCGGSALLPPGDHWQATPVCRAGEFGLFGKLNRLYLPLITKNRMG